ncbi:small integral membrane protein 44 isoform X2 [Ambystoma mexicanum]|uniref:small integral membrane protein 44 isoform X2 n=1 Tax=Ambystoma mexicanum TaxID=8296 RepID=UPI0037E814A2
MADSGSDLTIIPLRTYKEMVGKEKVQVRTTRHKPTVFGGASVELLGYIKGKVEFKGRETTTRVYFSHEGPAVLGWDDQDKLKIKLDPSTEDQVLSVCARDGPIVKSDYPKLFSEEPGHIKGFVHRIMLKKNAVPVKHRVRPVPATARDTLRDQLDKMRAEGVIEEVEASEWLSPVVLIKKPNSQELRVCIDLRSLNLEVITDNYPLPSINELILLMKEAKIFSKLDMRNAYHQIQLHEESKPLTAFITPFGTYQFTKMPFGLSSAASAFQRMMDVLLRKVKNVAYFQDDILVYAGDEQTHDATLKTVLTKLQDAGVRLCHEKCAFKVKEVEYLGYKISEKGISPKQNLMHAIIEAPEPTSKDEVRSFLGLAEYYAKFIPLFS